MRILARLLRDDGGQDLVEYTLLVMFFGVTVLAVWNSILAALGITFTDATAGLQSLWEPPDPGAPGP